MASLVAGGELRDRPAPAVQGEALVEAALRPTMRFVAVKTEDQQARAMLFRTRQMFVGQRTRMINATCCKHAFGVMRGHLAEQGLVAARGPAHLKRLADAIADEDVALPDDVRELGRLYLEQIDGLTARITDLYVKMKRAAKEGAWHATSIVRLPNSRAVPPS